MTPLTTHPNEIQLVQAGRATGRPIGTREGNALLETRCTAAQRQALREQLVRQLNACLQAPRA